MLVDWYEITGISDRNRAIIEDIGTRIGNAMCRLRTFHALEILETISRDLEHNAKDSVNGLVVEIRNKADGVFRTQNLAFQGFARAIRSLSKKLSHAHIGNSVHPEFAWNLLAKRRRELSNVIHNSSGLSVLCALIETASNKGSPHQVWRDLNPRIKHDVWDLFRSGLLKPKSVVVRREIFSQQVAHVASLHNADGVDDLQLLVKITDRHFLDASSNSSFVYDAIETAHAAVKGLKLAREIAASDFEVKLVLSFPRDGRHAPDAVAEVVDAIVKEEAFKDEIVGIDISGPEALMDHNRNTHYWATSEYEEALRLAAQAGLYVMAHLGDWGNTYKVHEDIPPKKQCEKRSMALAHIRDREEMVSWFLAFVRDGIEVLRKAWMAADSPPNRAPIVNHGIALAPTGSVITKGTRPAPSGEPERYSHAGQEITSPRNQQEIKRLLALIASERFEVRACPTVNTRSEKILLYREHPFFRWVEEGINATLHVDDLFWHGTGTTLSHDFAKMLLAAPEWTQCRLDEEGELWLEAGSKQVLLGTMPNMPDAGDDL